MITIQELFPLYTTACKWQNLTKSTHVRLIKEYTKIVKHGRDGFHTKIWMVDYVINNLDGPAFEEYFDDTSLKVQAWYYMGKLHRKNAPAYINYKPDRIEQWYVNGSLHRKNGPAEVIYFYNTDIIKTEAFYKNGSKWGLFTNKPFKNIKYNYSGLPVITNGPCQIEYDKNGQIIKTIDIGNYEMIKDDKITMNNKFIFYRNEIDFSEFF